MIGKVYLVGAGPGDPDLITRKGLRLIQTADVIIYDRLIPLALLSEARTGAELVNAGKAPTKHRLSQEDINAEIVRHALRGRMVVRLKGGDPLVFGRGSEEALACVAHGITFEIVPGISSSYSVPAYAGIPLTHRNVSSSFTVITGHEDPTKAETGINYEAVAKLGGTIVILMGVKHLPDIIDQLISAGLNPDTPSATIEWGATPQQRVIDGTAQTIATLSAEANIEAPAITVIGEVVALREAGTRWHETDLPEQITALVSQSA